MEAKETQCHPKPLVNATCLLGEKGCYENGKCHYIGNCEHKVLTNADRIRAMSDEELAELFHGFCDNGERCVYCPLYEKSCAGVHSDAPKWLEWLQQPCEEGG